MTTQVIEHTPASSDGWSSTIPVRESRGSGGGPIIARLRVVQPTSVRPQEAGCILGRFYIEERVCDDEGFWSTHYQPLGTELRALPLKVRKTRRLFSKDGKSVACRSVDGYTGKGDPGGECLSCPHAQWTDAPPACPPILGYALAVEGSAGFSLAEFEFSKGHFRTGEDLGDMIDRMGWGEVALRLSTERVSRGRDTWYQANLEYLAPATARELARGAAGLALPGGGGAAAPLPPAAPPLQEEAGFYDRPLTDADFDAAVDGGGEGALSPLMDV